MEQFRRAWCRGWFVILFMLTFAVITGAAKWVMSAPKSEAAFWLAIAAVVALLPACAYWLFIFFFGEAAWPFAPRPEPPEEAAYAILAEAERLQGKGRTEEARAKYQDIIKRFGATAAAADAQKSIEDLWSKIG